MNKILIFLFSIFLFTADNTVSAQIKPSLSITGGISIPSDEMSGELVSFNDSGMINISSDFIKNNYANSTGASISGALKIPIDKSGIVSGILNGGYTYFNAFSSSKLGTTLENGLSVPVRYDTKFSASTFGLGIELSASDNALISPYVHSEFTFNILSLSLLRNDFASVIFNDAFRMGLNTGAGVSIKLGNEYSLEVGGSYHMSNLFLKSEGSLYSERIEFGRENIPINDEEGTFYSNLSNPDTPPVQVTGERKNANWWNINIGINILLGIY